MKMSEFSLTIRRFRAPSALLALALGLAACGEEAPPPANDREEVIEEIAPNGAEVESAPPPAPVVENVVTNNVAEAPVGLDEEPVPVDQQTLEDADATGMTSRYAGDAEDANEAAPAE